MFTKKNLFCLQKRTKSFTKKNRIQETDLFTKKHQTVYKKETDSVLVKNDRKPICLQISTKLFSKKQQTVSIKELDSVLVKKRSKTDLFTNKHQSVSY